MTSLRRFARRSAAAWGHLVRSVDYPDSASDWSELLHDPQPLVGPFDWGLALGPYRRAGPWGRPRTRLGRLLDLAGDEDDRLARECLAELVSRALERILASGRFHCAMALPRSFASRTGKPVMAAVLERQAGRRLPVVADGLRWSYARSGSAAAVQAHDPDVEQAMQACAPVAGMGVLVCADLFRSGFAAAAAALALRARGAAHSGHFAICSDAQTADDP